MQRRLPSDAALSALTQPESFSAIFRASRCSCITGQANAGQTYANNASQLYQQQAAAVAANANRPSTGQKLIGGIGSGAAIGGSVGGPWGAAIGAGVGALGSLLY